MRLSDVQSGKRVAAPASLAAAERISAIVCTRNRPELLDTCLAGICQLNPAAGELIVVNQSDGDETARVVERYRGRIPGLRHLPTASRGLSRARNEGIRAAAGDIFAFTDDDCVVRPDWIGALAAAFGEEPVLAAVTGGSVPQAAAGLEARQIAVTTWYRDEPRYYRRPVDPSEVGGGFNLSFRRAWAEKVGLFDPDLGPGGRHRAADDTDFIHRILSLGGVIRYDPGVVVSHMPWRGEGNQSDAESGYGHGIAAWALKRLRQGDLFPARIALGVLMRQSRRVVSGAVRGDREAIRTGRAYLSGLARGTVDWVHERASSRNGGEHQVNPRG